ncbi:MAG TPA: FtsX-like permease family protein [Candidatus Saccharimonadales bacterium]|nr:FtsX-like permease family protein [Candidatus Saccharimonadales bacterium]
MNPVSRGIRNAFRNLTRTFSIVIILGLSTGLALAMLVANQAVSSKISDVKASVGNTISVTPAGFSSFSSVNNSLTSSQLTPLTKLANVTGVEESFTSRLSTNGASPSFFTNSNPNSSATTSLHSPAKLNLKAGRRFFFSGGNDSANFSPANFSLPVTLLATNNPTDINTSNLSIVSGKLIDATSDNNQALVSQSMASKNGLSVGSTFTAYSATLSVQGIFKDSTQGANNTVVVSLPTGQAISGQSGVVTNAVVYVNSIDNLASVTNAVKNSLGSSADVTSSQDQANQTVAPLNNVKSISVYSLIGAVIAGAVIILLTMVMIVRERTREIGVLKAIGASNSRISIQFMSEAITLTILGAIVGVILAVVAASPITHMLVTNSASSNSPVGFGGAFRATGGPRFISGGRGPGSFLRNNFTNIHAAVGWSVLGFGLLAAIVIAITGSAAVSFFISKIRPAEVMRAE